MGVRVWMMGEEEEGMMMVIERVVSFWERRLEGDELDGEVKCVVSVMFGVVVLYKGE